MTNLSQIPSILSFDACAGLREFHDNGFSFSECVDWVCDVYDLNCTDQLIDEVWTVCEENA
tara:strand:+ start:1667 stop:1849 length:183 start_codon:yes stop_codon:yes gene_type:complete